MFFGKKRTRQCSKTLFPLPLILWFSLQNLLHCKPPPNPSLCSCPQLPVKAAGSMTIHSTRNLFLGPPFSFGTSSSILTCMSISLALYISDLIMAWRNPLTTCYKVPFAEFSKNAWYAPIFVKLLSFGQIGLKLHVYQRLTHWLEGLDRQLFPWIPSRVMGFSWGHLYWLERPQKSLPSHCWKHAYDCVTRQLKLAKLMPIA